MSIFPTRILLATDGSEEVVKAQRQEAQRVLDEQVRRVEGSGAAVREAHLEMDERPDRAIVELSEKLGVGLVVVGSRGLGRLRRTLMGSVSDSVVRHAHCPVLVVRSQKERASEHETGPLT